MIDTKALRRLAQAALAGPDGISLSWIKLLQDFQQEASPAVVIELLDRLEAAENETASWKGLAKQFGNEADALRAKIAEMEKQEPTRDWWDCLIADISAIDCMYRGSPTYDHDAYWMREYVVQMLEQRRDALGAQGEEK